MVHGRRGSVILFEFEVFNWCPRGDAEWAVLHTVTRRPGRGESPGRDTEWDSAK